MCRGDEHENISLVDAGIVRRTMVKSLMRHWSEKNLEAMYRVDIKQSIVPTTNTFGHLRVRHVALGIGENAEDFADRDSINVDRGVGKVCTLKFNNVGLCELGQMDEEVLWNMSASVLYVGIRVIGHEASRKHIHGRNDLDRILHLGELRC